MAEKKSDPAPASGDAPSAPPPPSKSGGGIKAMLPSILAIVLAPAATFAVAHFLVLPRFEAGLKAALADPQAASEHAPAAAAPAAAKGGHGGAPAKTGGKAAPAHGVAAGGEGESYRFDNVVVNLSGTMGTRYLKVAFQVSGERADVASRFDAARPQLGDVTLAVLSSLTLSDLEEAGSKNLIRERLLAAYNQTLGSRVVDNLYFSEFVVQ